MRSTDGINFEIIAKVEAMGNYFSLHTYEFEDGNTPAGISYYKLVEYGDNGVFEEFKIVVIDNTSFDQKINAIYPNPASHHVTISLQAETAGTYFISLLDDQSKEIYSGIRLMTVGENQFNLSTDSYASGNYFVKIISPKKEIITAKLVVWH